MSVTHLSYSSVNKFRSCPKSWKFRYIDGVRGKKSEALEVGSMVHEIIESFLLSPGEKSLKEVYHDKLNSLIEEGEEENWPTIHHKNSFAMEKTEFSTDSKNFIIQIMEGDELPAILKSYAPEVESESIAVESKIEFNVPGVEIPVIGYIDLLTSGGRIVDFKTSKTSWNQDKADKELQASFYATSLYMNGIVPYDQPVFVDYVVMVKNKTPKIQVLTTTRTAEDIQTVFNTTSEIWKSIQREAFFPNASSFLCSEKYCDAWSLCEGGKFL